MSLTDGIVGCWSPSLGASGYRLLDRSGRGNHGTLTNMDAGTDWVGASAGLSLDYDGTNDYINCGAGAGRLLAVPCTVSAWAFARSVNNSSAGLVSRDFNAPYPFTLRNQAGVVNILTDGNSLSGNAWTLNAWRHYVVTLAPSLRRIYEQGVMSAESTSAYTVTASTDSMFIGADYQAGDTSRFWSGQIGEVAIFNRALAAAEVRELYRQGNGAIGRALTGQTRRRSFGFVPATGARRRRIITGMV